MIYTDGIHLISDTSQKDLHEFAQKIGLKVEWYQEHPRHPHYDITTKRMLRKALCAGAEVITSRDIVRIQRNTRGLNHGQRAVCSMQGERTVRPGTGAVPENV